MSNQLRRCCDCNFPIGNRDKFCPRCSVRQPREPRMRALALAVVTQPPAQVEPRR